MKSIVETKSILQAAKSGDFWVTGEDCDLVARVRSDTLLVTFDNLASINERPDSRPWAPWLDTRAETLGYSILGVQSHHKDWYRSSSPPEQIAALQEHGFFDRFTNIVFTGTSMGGFAALCFASLVPRAKVLAFSPQSTLNRDVAPFEERYPYPYRKFDWQRPDYLDAAQHVGDISSGYIFFDPKVPEDNLHAERLKSPSIAQVRIPYAGHTLIRVVIKAGAFEYLLSTYPATGQVDATFFRLMRNKRQNERWAKPCLAEITSRGDSRLTRGACKLLFKEYGYRFARRMQRQMIATGNPTPSLTT